MRHEGPHPVDEALRLLIGWFLFHFVVIFLAATVRRRPSVPQLQPSAQALSYSFNQPPRQKSSNHRLITVASVIQGRRGVEASLQAITGAILRRSVGLQTP